MLVIALLLLLVPLPNKAVKFELEPNLIGSLVVEPAFDELVDPNVPNLKPVVLRGVVEVEEVDRDWNDIDGLAVDEESPSLLLLPSGLSL